MKLDETFSSISVKQYDCLQNVVVAPPGHSDAEGVLCNLHIVQRVSGRGASEFCHVLMRDFVSGIVGISKLQRFH